MHSTVGMFVETTRMLPSTPRRLVTLFLETSCDHASSDVCSLALSGRTATQGFSAEMRRASSAGLP